MELAAAETHSVGFCKQLGSERVNTAALELRLYIKYIA